MADEKKTSWSSWIPSRYWALVASITAGLLYFNVFNLLFKPEYGSGACGTLLRPVHDDYDNPVWFWSASPFSLNMDLGCPRQIYLKWWELLASAVGIAVAGVVMRRAMKREQVSSAG